MKTETHHAGKLRTLLSKIKNQYPVEPPPSRQPLDQLVLSFLQWEATTKQALEAFDRLRAVMVDDNELRVSHPHEVMEVLGSRYPMLEERCKRLRQTLQGIYIRQRAMSLEFLAPLPKKQVRAALDTLPGIPPYVAAQMTLLCYKGHAVPVDSSLANMLVSVQVFEPNATLEAIESVLSRAVKANEATDVHLRLQAWSDEGQGKAAAAPGGSVKKTKAKTTTRRNPTKTATKNSAKGAVVVTAQLKSRAGTKVVKSHSTNQKTR